jgi:hypothetical protein
VANEFKKAFAGIDKAIKTGTTRALNRALSSASTELVKNLGSETGLKASVIKTRVLQIKAKAGKPSVQIAIATKVGVSLAEFSPLPKIVNVVHAGHTMPTRHIGATVRIAGSRVLVPGGFLWNAPSGKTLVLGRKDLNDNRSKLTTLRTKYFSQVAERLRPAAETKLLANFNEQIGAQLDYAIQSRFDANK